MPVRKFRSVEAMKRSTWMEPGSPALYRTIAALCDLGTRTGAHRFPPGVYRHPSSEEMNRRTESWELASFRAARKLRDGHER